MAGNAPELHDLSPRRIIGFACNQAFIFLTPFSGVVSSQFPFERFDLACVLLFMVLGFTAVRGFGLTRSERLFSRPLLYIYAVIAPIGLLQVILFPGLGLAGVVLQGMFVGMSSALLLTAWGCAFGAKPTRVSVPEVFLGSLVGALLFLAFSLAPGSTVVIGAVCLLPLASAVNIEIPKNEPHRSATKPDVANGVTGKASALSTKILAGTMLFGVAAGLMLLRDGGLESMSPSSDQVSFILYGAFLIGALSLLLSDGFGRGAALNKSYRLAVFIMMMGVLLVSWPLLAGSVLSGKAVVLAGYLGLEAVLISLFLVLSEIMGIDCALSFSAGFSALFIGELIGLLTSVAVIATIPDWSFAYVIVVLAGAIILLSYVFLFTERDFDALSQLVSESDSLEEAGAAIAERYGLSNRESEILMYALRGRTSERIAQELVISKSTVDTHLRRIYAKCGVHSRQELLDLAE